MRFPHFWRSRRAVRGDEPDDELAGSRSWHDSGLADELQAFLWGRLVDHLTEAGQPVPAWAVLNRLAHGDRSDLVAVVEGANTHTWAVHPAAAQPAWAPSERFVAGHLLALAPTPDDLRRIQQATLVPLELALIERSKVDRLTADRVLELGAEAVDSFHERR